MPVHTGTAKFELTLALAGDGDGLAGGLEYNADLFDAATARRMAGHLAILLAGAVADPDREVADLPLLAAAEARQVLTDWNATAAPFPRGRGLHELFEEQAARTPEATALIWGEERLSYRELDGRAARLARRLRTLGVGPEVLVGIYTRRTAGDGGRDDRRDEGRGRLRAARSRLPGRARGACCWRTRRRRC